MPANNASEHEGSRNHRWNIIPAIILSAALLMALAGGLLWVLSNLTSSAGGTLSSGRTVMTYADGLSISSRLAKDTATIQASGFSIVVEPTRLIVDGVVVARIDESVADVQVHAKQGTVIFIADGVPVEASP